MQTFIGATLTDVATLLQMSPFNYFIGIGVTACVCKIISGLIRPAKLY